MTCLRTKICSRHERPFLNPACSCPSEPSSASFILINKTLALLSLALTTGLLLSSCYSLITLLSLVVVWRRHRASLLEFHQFSKSHCKLVLALWPPLFFRAVGDLVTTTSWLALLLLDFPFLSFLIALVFAAAVNSSSLMSRVFTGSLPKSCGSGPIMHCTEVFSFHRFSSFSSFSSSPCAHNQLTAI